MIMKEKRCGLDVKKIELSLSEYNRKTLDFTEFKQYVQKKNEINEKLYGGGGGLRLGFWKIVDQIHYFSKTAP